MSSSVEALLEHAVLALVRNGEKEIATALKSLLKGGGLGRFQPPRAPEATALIDEVFGCDTLDSLQALLPRIAAALGATHCTVHCVGERGSKVYRARVLTTYPEAWATEYVERGYALVDPVVVRCREGSGIFLWDELPGAEGPAAALFEAAARAGVGPSGATFVSDNAHGNAVAVTLAAPDDPASFRRAFTPRLPLFGDIAALLIEVFAELADPEDRPTFRPTEDQLAALRALMRERPSPEAAADGLEARAAKAVLAVFGAESLAQAAALARRAGLLDDVPYDEDDIISACGLPRPV